MTTNSYAEFASSISKVAVALLNQDDCMVWENAASQELSSQGPDWLANAISQVSSNDLECSNGKGKDKVSFPPTCAWESSDGLTWLLKIQPVDNLAFPQVVKMVEATPLGDTIEGMAQGQIEGIAANLAQIDPLTGVLSRASFEQELASWIPAAAHKPFGLLFLDLDGFKKINDQYGHLEGDACLQLVGSRLLSALRSGDVVGRFGGDEFVLLIANVSCAHEVKPICERIRRAIEQTYELPDHEGQVKASIGWAFSRPEITARELLSEADRAMYAQKKECSRNSQ